MIERAGTFAMIAKCISAIEPKVAGGALLQYKVSAGGLHGGVASHAYGCGKRLLLSHDTTYLAP